MSKALSQLRTDLANREITEWQAVCRIADILSERGPEPGSAESERNRTLLDEAARLHARVNELSDPIPFVRDLLDDLTDYVPIMEPHGPMAARIKAKVDALVELLPQS